MAKQPYVRVTVSPEAEQAFADWVSNNGGNATKVFYAMWRALLDLPLVKRREMIAQAPKGSERTPEWATIQVIAARFQEEQQALAKLQDGVTAAEEPRRRKPIRPAKSA